MQPTMVTTTRPIKKKTNIFSLPVELRNKIWHHALFDSTTQCTRKLRRRPCRFCLNRPDCPPYHEPAILSVSRHVRAETQSVWYSTATFYFHDGSDKLLEFLVFLGNHKTSKIGAGGLVDEPGFGKAVFARGFLEEVYGKVRGLGVRLGEGAIEVSVQEGVRLLKSTVRKDRKVVMRMSDLRRGGGAVAIAPAPMMVAGRGVRVPVASSNDEDEGSWSETTLPNSDAESDETLNYSDVGEDLV